MKPMELLRVIFAAAWKDLQVIFRDRGALIVIIGLPMVFAMLNGSVNQQMMKSGEGLVFPVAVLNEDTGAFGSQVVSILDSIDILDLHPAESRAAAEADVRESKVLAAIFLPADLTGRVNAHQPTEVEVMIDPTQAGVAAARSSYRARWRLPSAPCCRNPPAMPPSAKRSGAPWLPNPWRRKWRRCRRCPPTRGSGWKPAPPTAATW